MGADVTDRWNPRKTIVDTPGPPPKFYVPSGESTLPSTVTEHPAGFRVRLRGDHEGLIKHAYRCPVHGEVEVHVPRGDVPDEVPCPLDSWSVAGGDKEYASREEAEAVALEAGIAPEQANYETQRCAAAAPWAGAACAIGISSGMVTC